MTKYILKHPVEAVQWFNIGDHPGVYEDYEDHGRCYKINGEYVNPGDYVLIYEDGDAYVMSEKEFLAKYKIISIKSCFRCGGIGAVGIDWCDTCNGTGKIKE